MTEAPSPQSRGASHVKAWKPAVPGVAEVFHAQFAGYTYPTHAHSTWTLFLVDDGVIRYDLDRQPHGSDASAVSVLPPHVVHDGRPAASQGYRKRVLYLDDTVLSPDLIGPAVDRPVIFDRALRDRLSAVHQLLASSDDALEAESRLAFVVQRLRRHLDGGAVSDTLDQPRVPSGAIAEQLRSLLDAHLPDSVTLATAGQALGADPAHLVRSFTQAFGIPPHAYVLGRRIELARQRLLDGHPASDVAVGVGFYDQSHFTRHFKRHVGTTPGRYAANSVGRR